MKTKDNKKQRDLYIYLPVDVETVEFIKLLIPVIQQVYPHLALMWKAHLIAGREGTEEINRLRGDSPGQSESAQLPAGSPYAIPPWHGCRWPQDVEHPPTSRDQSQADVS